MAINGYKLFRKKKYVTPKRKEDGGIQAELLLDDDSDASYDDQFNDDKPV